MNEELLQLLLGNTGAAPVAPPLGSTYQGTAAGSPVPVAAPADPREELYRVLAEAPPAIPQEPPERHPVIASILAALGTAGGQYAAGIGRNPSLAHDYTGDLLALREGRSQRNRAGQQRAAEGALGARKQVAAAKLGGLREDAQVSRETSAEARRQEIRAGERSEDRQAAEDAAGQSAILRRELEDAGNRAQIAVAKIGADSRASIQGMRDQVDEAENRKIRADRRDAKPKGIALATTLRDRLEAAGDGPLTDPVTGQPTTPEKIRRGYFEALDQFGIERGTEERRALAQYWIETAEPLLRAREEAEKQRVEAATTAAAANALRPIQAAPGSQRGGFGAIQ